MENTRLENMDELVERGNQLHDRAIGDFFLRLAQKAALWLKRMSVGREEAARSNELSLKRSRRVAV